MTTVKKMGAIGLMMFGLAACSNMNDSQQRTLSGGAIGAAGGAVVGALTGSWVAGALIGGAGGAAVGAITSENNRK
ncbi:MAG: YMGG-like glycine zipper-containing protein [Alphaproteobacteria bacterium]